MEMDSRLLGASRMPRVRSFFAPYPLTRLERGAWVTAGGARCVRAGAGVEQFKEFRQLILVGARAPIAYFAYPGKDSVFTSPECEIHTLASPAKIMLEPSRRWKLRSDPLPRRQHAREKIDHPALPEGDITLAGLAAVVGALLPENSIVVDESMTSGRGMMARHERRSSARLVG